MQIPYLNQILLFVVVSVLATVLTLAGIQVIHILAELKISVKKLNQIMDDCQLVSSSVAKPVAGVSNFLMGLKNGLEVFNMIKEVQKPSKEKK